MHCNRCNHKIPNSAIFCSYCGNPIDRSTIPPKKKANKKTVFSIIYWCIASVCSLLIIFNAVWCVMSPLGDLPVFNTIIDTATEIAEDTVESINQSLKENENLIMVNKDGDIITADEYIKDIKRTVNNNSILEVSGKADFEDLSNVFNIVAACISALWLLALVMTVLSAAFKRIGMAAIAMITSLVTSFAFSGIVFTVVYTVLFVAFITFLIIIKVMDRQYNKETVTE